MKKNETYNILKELVRHCISDIKFYSIDAIVESVNESERTCICKSNNNKYLAYITSNINTVDDLFICPKIGSEVTLSFLDKEFCFVSKFGSIEKIIINNGDNGGVLIHSEVESSLKSLELFSNRLKNSIASALGTIDTVAGSTGSATFNLAMAGANINISNNMVNNKIKH